MNRRFFLLSVAALVIPSVAIAEPTYRGNIVYIDVPGLVGEPDERLVHNGLSCVVDRIYWQDGLGREPTDFEFAFGARKDGIWRTGMNVVG